MGKEMVGGRELQEYEEFVGMINVHTAVIIDRIHPRLPKILIRDTARPHSEDWEMSKESAVNFAKLIGPMFEEEEEDEAHWSTTRWIMNYGFFIALFIAAAVTCIMAVSR
jgi:hypothetical protein